MPLPNDVILRTVADEILDLVKKKNKTSVEDIAKELKIPVPTIQSLVDFLVEERVFGIEYKFTTPYIYLYQEGIKEAKAKEKGFTKGLITKEHFYESAKRKKVPYEYIGILWRKYLQQNIVNLREEFLTKAREKNIPQGKIEALWNKYLSYL